MYWNCFIYVHQVFVFIVVLHQHGDCFKEKVLITPMVESQTETLLAGCPFKDRLNTPKVNIHWGC